MISHLYLSALSINNIQVCFGVVLGVFAQIVLSLLGMKLKTIFCLTAAFLLVESFQMQFRELVGNPGTGVLNWVLFGNAVLISLLYLGHLFDFIPFQSLNFPWKIFIASYLIILISSLVIVLIHYQRAGANYSEQLEELLHSYPILKVILGEISLEVLSRWGNDKK